LTLFCGSSVLMTNADGICHCHCYTVSCSM
jgi:hypothetical protein